MRSKEARAEYQRQIDLLQRFIEDPWPRQNDTVQVMVPKVFRSPPSAPPQHPPTALGGDDKAEDEAALAGASAQRVALQRRAAATSVAALDYARKFEFGDLSASVKDNAGEEENQSNTKVMCWLCFSGENEGTERARKMLPCNSCGKKYHGNCLKMWSQNRDLFHWSLWTCPSCRICEVCHQTGDQNELMFCKRCDDAYHCFCLQHPHKNVSHGPFLCPKHTRCHSCRSTVPGNGISVRWYLGYTCCDACGRLFVKGNYCPVCLKVYRDSESTPMVCCDICERWVHCLCDGISDEKYMQFQVDVSLQYVCPVCRGECRQVRDLEEAVEELWRMRDEADKQEIATLRGAAGLPTHEEIFQISPFSDDDKIEPSTGEYSRSLKLPLKGFREKSPKKSEEYGKRASNTKYGEKESPLFGSSTANKNEEIQFYGEPNSLSSAAAGRLTEGMPSIIEAGLPLKHKFISEVLAISRDKASITTKTNSAENCCLSNREDVGNNTSMSKPEKGPKLVIHFGGHIRNITSPPRSEASSFRIGQDSSVDVEDMAHLKVHEYFDNAEIKSGDHKGCKIDDADQVNELGSPINDRSSLGKRSIEDVLSDFPNSGRNKYSKLKYGEDGPSALGDLMDDKNAIPSISESLPKDQKSHLKFKIPKKSNNGNQDTESLPDNKTFAKGQRSKRRRPAKFEERASIEGADNTLQQYEDYAIESADKTQQQSEDDAIEGADNAQQQYEDDAIEGADNTQQQYEGNTIEGGDNRQQQYDDTVEGGDNTQQHYEGDIIEGADNTQQQYEGDTIEGADNTQQQHEDNTIEGADNTQQQYEGDTNEGACNTQQQCEDNTVEGADNTQQQYEGDTIEGACNTQQQCEDNTVEGADNTQQQYEGNTIEGACNTQRQYEDDTIEGADDSPQQYEDDRIEDADDSPQQCEDDTIEGADDSPQQYEDDTMNDLMDATWVLQKLGKEASGKKVEIHQPSNNSWHRGMVVEVIKGASFVSIALDDGRVEEFEFGKQRICFVPPKQKR